jgi:hypothetical protein
MGGGGGIYIFCGIICGINGGGGGIYNFVSLILLF